MGVKILPLALLVAAIAAVVVSCTPRDAWAQSDGTISREERIEAETSTWKWFIYNFPGQETGFTGAVLLVAVCTVAWVLRKQDFVGPAALIAGVAALGGLNILGVVDALVNVILLLLAALIGLALYRGSRAR